MNRLIRMPDGQLAVLGDVRESAEFASPSETERPTRDDLAVKAKIAALASKCRSDHARDLAAGRIPRR